MKNINILFSLFYLSLFTVIILPQDDFLTKNIDKSVSPGNDFFKYATGTWTKNNPIPESERAWGIGNLVQEESYNRLKSILENAANNKNKSGTSEQKIGDFYFTGMDTMSIEKQGISPLKPEFNKINAVLDKKELLNVTALLQTYGVDAMFGGFVGQDQKNSDQWALYLWQGGLGLPNREYYFRNDTRTEDIRVEYHKHLANMFILLGEDPIKANIDEKAAYQIELFLADSSRKLEDLRDPYGNYNKMFHHKLKELKTKNPNEPEKNYKDYTLYFYSRRLLNGSRINFSE